MNQSADLTCHLVGLAKRAKRSMIFAFRDQTNQEAFPALLHCILLLCVIRRFIDRTEVEFKSIFFTVILNAVDTRHSAFYYSPGKEKKNGVNSSACIFEGSYRFSFKFIIPDKYLPTSFEGRHGNIRYWARAVIERSLGKSNVKTKPAQFLIGDYVALEDFEHVSVSKVSDLRRIIENLGLRQSYVMSRIIVAFDRLAYVAFTCHHRDNITKT